jgi:uncharacterized phage infection (PIP) family protein YhgE
MSDSEDEGQNLSGIDPTEDSATELIAGQYTAALAEIDSLNSKIENIQNATTFISRIESAVERVKNECNIDGFSELEEKLEIKYVNIGRTIFSKLDDTDILYDSSDVPKKLQNDFEDFCDAIIDEYSTREQIECLTEERTRINNELSSYPGENPAQKLNRLRKKLKDYEDAQHLLSIKGGQCDLCKTKWEELDSDRQEEITDTLDEYEEEYGAFDEDKIEDEIEQIESDVATIDDLKEDLNAAQNNLNKLLNRDILEDLQRLQKEHGEQE